ncbi:MAG: Rrf2 family transcriptional regulator [Acidobacteriaceae bacterium]|nr:Rrf2 family transcriptional regulator [Acidobacteriaceae bacterium]
MQLTRFSDLSLRVLMYLASRDEPLLATVTVRQASSLFNVPYTHMVKVVHNLGREGLLATSKGRGGGVRLARPAAQIRIGDVLRRTETNKAIIDCFAPACPLRRNCLLKEALDRAYDAFFEEMNRCTLADVARSPALQSLVSLPA